jgi:hypothetical protein
LEDARERCIRDTGAGRDLRFVRWLRDRIPADARYELVAHKEIDGVCLNFNLLPRRQAASPRDARWVILYGAIPREFRTAGSLRRYARGLAVVKQP